ELDVEGPLAEGAAPGLPAEGADLDQLLGRQFGKGRGRRLGRPRRRLARRFVGFGGTPGARARPRGCVVFLVVGFLAVLGVFFVVSVFFVSVFFVVSVRFVGFFEGCVRIQGVQRRVGVLRVLLDVRAERVQLRLDREDVGGLLVQ